jgi:SAM-dependent methyltransferase
MYAKSAEIYDAIYEAIGKDYAEEAERLHQLIQEHKRSSGNALLDVACGTGGHLEHLKRWYDVEGLDISPEMLKVARRQLQDVPLYQGDLLDFKLERTFDAITCLFGSIGYVKTRKNLHRAIANMVRHLKPGGMLIVEPWIKPEDFRPNYLHANFIDRPDLKAARISLSKREGRIFIGEFHYLVGTPEGIEYFTERHELGMFTHEEYLESFRTAGLDVTCDPEGLIGRGLYIGVRT